MASIKKRGKTWSYSVSLGTDTITKKQKQKTRTGFATRKEAQKEADIVERRYKNGVGRLVSNRNKFSEVVEDWLHGYAQEVKPGTLYLRKKALKKILPVWGNVKIDTIDRRAYRSFILELHQKHSRNYVDTIHHTLNLIFKFALEMEIISTVPCQPVKTKNKKTKNSLENFLEKDKLKEFLKLTEKTGHYNDFLIFYTLSLTGLRIGELLALRWQDIDLENKVISVNHTLYNPSNNENTFELLEPKTMKSKRKIPMADKLVEAFADYKIHVESCEKKQTAKSFVFFKNGSKPLTNTFVRNRLVSILKKWNHKKSLTLHSFRHTFASLLIEQGESLLNVSEMLGHSDTTITNKIYTHLTQTRHLQMQSSVSKFAASL